MRGISGGRWIAALAAFGGGALICPAASAVTMDGLEGFDHIFGSYAPGGDCSLEPRVTLNREGMTFTASGRTVQVSRVDYSASFFGQRYEGIAIAFYPFPRAEFEPGDVIMLVNDDEVVGRIAIHAEPAPGQRMDPFQAALHGDYALCPGTGSGVAPPQAEELVEVPGIPLEWNNLAGLTGRYMGRYSEDNIDLFDAGAVAAALRTMLGGKMAVLEQNLSVAGPLERQGNIYHISGNAPHSGGEDQAYVLIDPARRAVQVGLWEQGKLTVYAPAGGRLPIPRDIQTFLDGSPGEQAHARPGPPWELLPVQGREPVAYVEPAASTSITSLSVYCENGRPYMSALLGRPATGARITFTWNFAGRIVNIPLQRATNDGTYWVGGVSGTPVLEHLMGQWDMVNLRIEGRLEGEASLANARATLRTAMRSCARL